MNLQAKATELGATELQGAQIEEFKKSDSGAGTSSNETGLGAGAITGIAFGIFAAGVLIAAGFFLLLMHREDEKEIDEETGIDASKIVTVKAEGTRSRNISTHETINPMQRTMPPVAPNDDKMTDSGTIRSFSGVRVQK